MHTRYGLSFIYVVLPVAVGVFLLSPPAWRPSALMLLSLGYYLLAQPRELLYMVSCVAMDWAVLLVMERFDDAPNIRRVCLIFSVCKNIGMIVWLEEMLRAGRLGETPLGLKIFALSGLWCVAEVYRRKAPYLESPIPLAAYCCYFPRLAAGPMMPYSEFAPQLEAPSPTLADLGQGGLLFLQGAAKTAILGVELLALYEKLVAIPEADRSVAGVWCAVFVLALSVYYRYSGYASMARGVAKMMGLTLPRNFYYPYQARSVEDFFDRFNIGIGRFWRSILPPAKGNIGEGLRILLIGAACGCFFGLRATYLVWGLSLAGFVVLERYLYPKLLARIPTLFRRVYAFFIVLCSFVVFGAERLSDVGNIFYEMFGSSALPFFTGRLGYLLSTHWLLLTVSVLLALNALSLLLNTVRSYLPKTAGVLSAVSGMLLLVAVTAFSL